MHASANRSLAQTIPADVGCFAERNGRKTLTTVQGIPSKFDHKKILKVVKKDFGMFLLSTTGTDEAYD